ncbi:MAG TPA: hypothetical protein VET48_10910 [Steroidobacteraceae bacterium]|nr:hypothetical protein [Steroidobacteraceae bacterium]
MQQRFIRIGLSSVLLATVVAAFGVTMAADAPAAKPAAKAAYKPPHGPDGHPDLNGIWQALNSANYDIEPHSARAALQMVPGQFVPVPAPEVVKLGAVGSVPAGLGIVVGNEIPYKPEALAKKKENQANWITSDPEIKCYLPGVPRANYMPYPFQISQSKSAIFFAYEYAGAVRNIYLKDPGPAPTDSWMGQSVGHWEGDTLVVDVTGLNDRTWFDRAGNFHSEQMHVVERYTPVSPDHIMYEATIEDPQVFTHPWKISMPLYRRIEKNAQLMQFKCVEFVEELMYGHLRKKPTQPAPQPANK